MKKKLLLLIILSFALTSCNNEHAAAPHTSNDQDFLYILYATPLENHPIWMQSKEGFEKACSELHAKCDWIGPKVIDTVKMEDVMIQGILQKADGIITQGVIHKDLLKQASDANIPVILVDSNIEDGEKFAYYGKNFHRQAKLLLQEVEKKIKKQEKLIIGIQVAEMSFQIAMDQIQEIENVFKEHPGGYEIVEVTESKSDKIRAQSEWMSVLRKHPEMNVAINFAAESADACGEIAQTLNIKDQLYIYGVDDMETTINYIHKGLIDASIVTSFFEYGYKTVYQIYDYQKKGIKPKKIDNEVKIITVNKDNVDTYKSELAK